MRLSADCCSALDSKSLAVASANPAPLAVPAPALAALAPSPILGLVVTLHPPPAGTIALFTLHATLRV